jgi:hypothetical protein
MCIGIAILPVEEETAAALRIQVPEQDAETTFGQEAGQVYGCCGFSNASLDIVYSNLFQNLNLITKLWLP